MMGLLAMAVCNAAVCLGAHEALRKIRTGESAIDLLLFLLIRLVLISATLMVAGVLGVLRAGDLGVLGLLALVSLLLCGAWSRLPRLRPPAAGRVAALLAVVLGIRILFQIWILSPCIGDTLSYHLTKIAEWVRAGAFTREMGTDTHAPFPAGFEIIETWWVVFLHHDVLIEAAGVEFLFLGFVATLCLARSCGISDRGAFLAALMFCLTPVISLSAVTCVNDIAASTLVLAVAALLRARVPIALLLIPVGLGCGVKPTFVYALPGLLVLGLPTRRSPANPIPSKVCALALSGLALGIGAFWYARNFLWFGNPIYPVGTMGLIAKTGGLKIQFGPKGASLLENVLDLVNLRMRDQAGPYSPHVMGSAGWGPLAFGCGLLSLIPVWRMEPRFRRLALSLTLSLLCVFALVNHDPWNVRFVGFFPAVLAISLVRLAEDFRPLFWLAAPALAFQFLGTMVPAELPASELPGQWRQGWRERSRLIRCPECPEEDRIAYLSTEPVHTRGESYLLYRPDFSKQVVYLRGQTADELLEEMARAKVMLLYVSSFGPQDDPVIVELLRKGLIRRLSSFYYRVVS